MLKIFGTPSDRPAPVTRREIMRVGGIGLGGLALSDLLRHRAEAKGRAGRGPAKSVIVLFNSGGMPHHETWDPKPEAPKEVRGDFGVIPTKTPGYFVGELMPKTAALTDRIAVIRTMQTRDNAHSTSGYQMMTGVPHIPLSRENAAPGKPNDAPNLGAVVQALRASQGGLPSAIMLPRKLANFGGLNPWPGNDAGALGRKFDPWLLECDPADPKFAAPGCALPDDLPSLRLDDRLSLLKQLDQSRRTLEQTVDIANYDRYRQQTIDLIAGGRAGAAFDMAKEPDAVRNRYGRTKHGQCVLLARRLVEAGVSLVQVNWASPNKSLPNSGGWDTHDKHSESLKGWLMPNMDQTYSALITDLEERGLLDETLVLWVAEFGHTPKFNQKLGRDHWGKVFSIALAGGGVRGGVVHGSTDRDAAAPLDAPVTPADYLATVFHCLGYDPDTIVRDVQGRPLPIARGRVVREVLA